MKQFKTWFEEFKEMYPDVHHDEIDCGLSWKFALTWVRHLIKNGPTCGEMEMLDSTIKKEIGNAGRNRET